MSTDQTKVVDFISIDKDNNVVLTISDHLQWDDKNTHLLLLQDKLNSYLSFIESGEIYDKYPDAKDRRFVIQIVAQFELQDDAVEFLNKICRTLKKAGLGFQFKQNELVDSC